MALALDTLVYAKRLRDAGFSEQQAEGQAQALAAAMTDALASKHDLHELKLGIDDRFTRIDGRFEQIGERLVELERRIEIRFEEHTARFNASLADLERRMTMRLGAIMVGGIGVLSALVALG